jgi:hypothetical protein
MLIWLLIGPVPLFLVLAYQAHRQPAKKQSTPNSRPSVLMVTAPMKPANHAQAETDATSKNPEMIKNSQSVPVRKAARQ